MRKHYCRFSLLLPLFSLILYLSCFAGCAKSNPYKDKSKRLIKPAEELSLNFTCSQKKERVYESVLKNQSDVAIDLGSYELEFKYKEEWFTVPRNNADLGTGELVLAGNESIREYDLSESYSSLSKGKYRIVLRISVYESNDAYGESKPYYIACEFEI